MTAKLIEIAGLSKRFPGVVALDDVDIAIGQNEVVGLIGQNGSGKSTLLKVLAGVHQADAGTVTLRDEQIAPRSVTAANQLGIGMVFQEQSLLPNISVAENIFLGKRHRSTRGGWYRWSKLRAAAKEQLEKIDSNIDPAATVAELSFGERQMVELAKVLALEELTHQPPVVLFDEPTSVLSGAEIEVLFRQIRRLSQRSGVVFVSHRLEEVLEISDRVYVMADGEVVAERPAAESDTDELYRLMVGSQRAEDYYLQGSRTEPAEEVRLAMRDGCASGKFEDVSFELKAGSILGVAGVVGSGREGLCRALFGAEPLSGGVIELDGRKVSFRSPSDAVRAGIGYVPAERKVEGMVAGRDLRENFVIASGSQFQRGPFINRGREVEVVDHWITDLKVKAPSRRVPIDTLSGGNQQKVVLGKWLISERLRVLILDHPTRGLDLGAKADIYRVVRELASKGLSIVLLSDTLDETLGLADEVLVMRDGAVSAEFSLLPGNERPSSEKLVEAMV